MIKANIAELNLADATGTTPLMHFAESSTIENTRMLLIYGADIESIDYDGENALSRAASAGRLDMVIALLDWVVTNHPQVQRNLVYWSVKESHIPLIEMLIQNDIIDVNEVIEETNRHTSLHLAAMRGSKALVELLLESDADLSIADINRNTPLHLSLTERNLEVAKVLIRHGAPLEARNRSNKGALDLCAEFIPLKDFVALMQESNNGLIALICSFILRTSIPDKYEVLKNILINRVEYYPPDLDDSGPDPVPSNSPIPTSSDDATPDAPKPPELRNFFSSKSSEPSPYKAKDCTFFVNYTFDDIFAHTQSNVGEWNQQLQEEYGIAAENLFWTSFFTFEEGRNLLKFYYRNFDPVGLWFVVLSYLVCMILGFLTVVTFGLAIFVAAIAVGIYISFSLVLWLNWRFILSPSWNFLQDFLLWYRARNNAGGLDETGTTGTPHVSSPHRLRHRRHRVPKALAQFYYRYTPGYIVAWIISGFYCQWETIKENRNRRPTRVCSKYIDIQDACAGEPAGILSALVRFDTPSWMFGIEPVQAVIDYKYRTFARGIVGTELFIYLALLLHFTFYLQYLHDPSNHRVTEVTADNFLNFEHYHTATVLVLLFRMFKLELINLFHSKSFKSWASSVWNWINISSFLLFLYAANIPAHVSIVSMYMSSIAILLWWRLLYFFKAYRPTGTLVQAITTTMVEVRWFLLLLAIIFCGFGSTFYILFRIPAQKYLAKKQPDDPPFDYGTPITVFLTMLSAFLGNIEIGDYVGNTESAVSIFFLLLFVVLGK